jgi:hypothetical protein
MLRRKPNKIEVNMDDKDKLDQKLANKPPQTPLLPPPLPPSPPPLSSATTKSGILGNI